MYRFNWIVVVSILVASLPLAIAADYAACAALPAGVHTISTDIIADQTNCFVFTENNTELDCQGNTIDGTYTYTGAFLLEHVGNITIHDCVIQTFDPGAAYDIQMYNTSNSTLYDITILNSTTTGINIDAESNENRFLNVWINSSANIGVAITNSSKNIFTNLRITNSLGYGFFGVDLNETIVQESHIENSSLAGLYYATSLTGATNNTLRNSTIILSDTLGLNSGGIELTTALGNYFYNNYFNNSFNVIIDAPDDNGNFWNTTLDCAGDSNIIGGDCIGGNFWAFPNGSGFSQTCSPDVNDICDSTYTIGAVNEDYYALALSAPSNTPPTIVALAPLFTLTNWSNMTFSCQATDASPLENVSLYINGTRNQTATTGLASYIANFTTTFVEGYHNWSCLASDVLGVTNTTDNTSLLVDLTAPTFSYGALTTANGTYNQSYIVVQSTISDATSGVKNHTVQIYNSTSLVQTNISNVSMVINRTGLSDGNYTVNATSSDHAGNIRTLTNRSITLDTSAPIVNITSPLNQSTLTSASVVILFNASDTTLLNCTLLLQGLPVANYTNATSGTYNYSASMANGAYSTSVSCVDTVLYNTTTLNTSFSVSVSAPVTPPSSGGGGGGGGRSSGSSYIPYIPPANFTDTNTTNTTQDTNSTENTTTSDGTQNSQTDSGANSDTTTNAGTAPIGVVTPQNPRPTVPITLPPIGTIAVISLSSIGALSTLGLVWFKVHLAQKAALRLARKGLLDSRVITFVQNCLSHGVQKEAIIQKLSSVGWSQKVIEEAFMRSQ